MVAFAWIKRSASPDSTTILGYAELLPTEEGRFKGVSVVDIFLKPEHRNRGIGMSFYRFLLDQGMTLFSGGLQTPDGRRSWEKLVASPDVETIVLDGEFDFRGSIRGYRERQLGEIDPWEKNPEHVEDVLSRRIVIRKIRR